MNQTEPLFDQLFELNNLKAELQEKDMTIKKLKAHISVSKTSTLESVKKDLDETETINIELEHRVTRLIAKNERLKQMYKQVYDLIKPSCVHAKEQTESLANQMLNATTMAPGMYKLDPIILAHRVKNNRETHEYYLKHTMEQAAILRDIVEQGVKPSTSASGSKPLGNTKNERILLTPSSNEKNKVEVQSKKVKSKLNKQNSNSKNVCKEHVKHPVKGALALCSVCNECLFDANHAMLTTTNKVPLRVPIPLEVVTPEHVVTRVYTRRPKVPKFVPNKNKVAKSMTANRMEPGTSQGSDTSVAPSSSSLSLQFLGIIKFGNDQVAKIMGYDLEVAFRKHTCFVRNLEGVDLLSGSRGINLYSLSIKDMMMYSPICLFSKATKTKSWLWHQRLSHLNFGALNHLARNGLVRGLPRLKFEKDHLCSTCAIGKSKKQSHKPKSKDTNQEKLYLLHMDLCGPMRVASINRKKYILVIMDDYSRFIWVKFLASKDEAADFVIKFLKMIQVRLNVAIRNICTDNGTEFVNQTLRDYYEQVDISYKTSVARTLQQNGVVERRNRTLVEAARTMLIYAKAPLFLWAEATQMLSEQSSLEHALHEMTPATPSLGLVPNPPPSTLFVPPSRREWDLMFQPVFDEFFFLPASVASPVPVEEAPTPVESTSSPSSITVDQDVPSPSTSQTTSQS
ncbi:retrovirus-related pol polyprotein from transposon TNT 1-94 [Tanacetum coccineum]